MIAETGKVSILKDQLSSYKSALLNLLNDWHHLTQVVHPQIMFVYENIFGDLEFEIKHKTELAIKLEKKIEILKSKVKVGEFIGGDTEKIVDAIAKNYAENQIEKMSKIEFTLTNNTDYTYNCAINDDYDLPRLYRTLVKMLHPDKNGESELYQKYWQQIQDSYRTKDVERLRLFYKILSGNDYTQSSEKNAEISMQTEIKDIQSSIIREKNRLSRLKRQEPFCFEENLNDSIWISRRKRILRDRLINLKRKISLQEQQIQRILSNNHVFRGSSLRNHNSFV